MGYIYQVVGFDKVHTRENMHGHETFTVVAIWKVGGLGSILIFFNMDFLQVRVINLC